MVQIQMSRRMCKTSFNLQIIWIAYPRRCHLSNRTYTRSQVSGCNQSAVDDQIGYTEDPIAGGQALLVGNKKESLEHDDAGSTKRRRTHQACQHRQTNDRWPLQKDFPCQFLVPTVDAIRRHLTAPFVAVRCRSLPFVAIRRHNSTSQFDNRLHSSPPIDDTSPFEATKRHLFAQIEVFFSCSRKLTPLPTILSKLWPSFRLFCRFCKNYLHSHRLWIPLLTHYLTICKF